MVQEATRAVVIDGNPAAREGIQAALTAAGIVVDESVDSASKVRDGTPCVVMAAIRNEADWKAVERLGGGDAPVVALLGMASTVNEPYHRALSLGVQAAIPANLPTRVIAEAVRAVSNGLALIPADLARMLAADGDLTAIAVRPAELGWLRALARGRTVSDLAAEAGWSERSMHRRLNALYQRIGVQNRTEAVAWLMRREAP